MVMNKLIVVGMRHCPSYSVSRVNKFPRVTLSIEENSNGVCGKAIAVYHESLRIGFIRNKDLDQASGPEVFGHTVYQREFASKSWHVSKVYENYLVLESVDNNSRNNDYANAVNPLVSGTKTGRTSASTPEQNPCKEIKLESENMMAINTNSMRDQFFREVKNVAIDIQSGKFGIVSSDGISVFDNGTVNVNPIQELGVKIPAFAMRVAADTLQAGDIVFNGADAAFFMEAVKEGGYKLMSTSGEVTTVGNVKNMFFGANSVLAVKNMFSGSGMNPMMMAMFMGDGKMDSKTLMMMAMMGGSSGGNGMDPNMLMMMMLADK